VPGIRRNISFLLLSQGVNVGGMLLVIALSARYLGVARYGQLAVLRSIALFALPLLAGGLRINILKEVGRDPKGAHIYLGNVLALRSCLGASAGIGAAIIVRALPLGPDLEMASYAAILLALSGLWLTVPVAILIAYERSEYNLLMSMVNNLLTILLTVVAVALDTGVAGVLAASALPNLAIAQTAQALVHRHLVRPRLTIDLARWGQIVRSSLPLGVSGVLRRSYERVDVWLLAGLKGATAAALFSVAYRVAVEVISASRLIGSAVMPRISLLAQTRQDQLRTAVERLLLLLLAVSVPFAGVVAAWAAPILALMVGPQFGGSVPAMRMLAVVCVTALPGALLFFAIVAVGREKTAVGCLVVALVANVVFDVILIPPLGLLGACLGTIIAEWTYFIVSLVVLCREVGISSIWRFVVKPLAAGGPMAAAIWLAGPQHPVVGSVAGLSAFALSFVLLRTLPRGSVRELRRALAVSPAGIETVIAPTEEYE
jgi:O-antigen/teichoic acid export membrane protein